MVDDDIGIMMKTIMTKCDNDDDTVEISQNKTVASRFDLYVWNNKCY